MLKRIGSVRSRLLDMTAPKAPNDRAKLQQERAIDGAAAMVEYRAAEKAEHTKTDRLRAARLARDTAPVSKVKKAAKPKKA